ncbi:flagellar export chaperone FliS [Arthrobacter sp. N199823]|uniref:flagellar export chaperone FliS n=1 Tax=Arthrobacter sp. N199823 TaxID=2058895 RepID=UPI000CE4713B|nr:flagellar export chaperone FliS [Arthrobacter sp. N199823]
MITTPNRTKALNAYQRDAILSAPPARLLTMLYDRLLLDLARAETAQTSEDWLTASENLLHAQDIIAELSGSLMPELWDGADQLLGIYNHAGSTLVQANIQRDRLLTQECIALLEPLRLAWHEAAALPMSAMPAAQGGSYSS